MSDIDRQIERLMKCERLNEHEVKSLCLKAMEILVEESNVQRVDAPVTSNVQRVDAPVTFSSVCENVVRGNVELKVHMCSVFSLVMF
ncbi:serine/threonine-protein phosphatase PP-X isozyme 2 [Artemisia annua]|uniref:Serine/threonine-protein phosphatase PP-X isozyme 2 n=1 Tax=Artemisia annua TaxID=35608 RepID=A0A2U1NHU1_ARTAN|nr:serine/threonine-protein phosphatase PP-X isozyme 2 [Artemisia annua]